MRLLLLIILLCLMCGCNTQKSKPTAQEDARTLGENSSHAKSQPKVDESGILPDWDSYGVPVHPKLKANGYASQGVTNGKNVVSGIATAATPSNEIVQFYATKLKARNQAKLPDRYGEFVFEGVNGKTTLTISPDGDHTKVTLLVEVKS